MGLVAALLGTAASSSAKGEDASWLIVVFVAGAFCILVAARSASWRAVTGLTLFARPEPVVIVTCAHPDDVRFSFNVWASERHSGQ
jgi:uncharacterized protein (DUF1501 family)